MRKKLLSEAQVRRFQSLASIKPLNEMDSSYKKHDDEDKMEEMAYKKDDLEENLYEEEALYEEEEGDEDMDEADVEMDEELVQKFMDAVDTMKEVADVLGGEVGGDMDMGGDEPADDMDMGDDEEPLELGADDAEPAGEKDEEEMLQEALRGINYIPSKKEVVKTVAKRVAKRLQEAKHAQARLDRALGKRR